MFVTERGVLIASEADGTASPDDGQLTLAPNELFFAFVALIDGDELRRILTAFGKRRTVLGARRIGRAPIAANFS